MLEIAAIDSRIKALRREKEKLKELLALNHEVAALTAQVYGNSELSTAGQEVVKLVCQRLGVTPQMVVATTCREIELVNARHIIFFVSHELSGKSRSVLGRIFGVKGCTVGYGIRRIRDLTSTDRKFAETVDGIRQECSQFFTPK